MSFSKEARRKKIRSRIRGKVVGTPESPRLSVYRSNKEIYAQVINDLDGKTLVAASSLAIKGIDKMNKVEQAKVVGKTIAERAVAAGIEVVVFDRGGYLYHGRVKSLAEGAREGGLKF
jgi:large subunit ribosomal protein L18